MTTISPNIQILLPSDWSNTRRGDYFEDFVAKLLQKMRFRVVQRVRLTGMEIDCLAENIDSQERGYVECKFVKDPFEADFISKMIGNAIEQEAKIAYLFSTAHPGKDAKGKLEEIRRKHNVVGGGILKVAFVGPSELVDMYIGLNNLLSSEILLNSFPEHIKASLGSLTLVIAPEESCWVVEQKRGGVPEKAYVIPVVDHSGKVHDFETIKALIDDAKLWVGLPLINGLSTGARSTHIAPSVIVRDVVTTVPSADKFEDYRPARPEDFVGRSELVSEVFNFLSSARSGSTSTRIIALSAPSGFGKSSIVLYLSNKCRNSKWKNQFYLYPIDARSAVSPLFVIEAIRAGFQKAIDDGFIKVPENSLSIDSVEDPLSSSSMQESLRFLEDNQRVLILFFDQFEELFVKESLYDTFEAFRRFASVIEAVQSNVILGFSWRTGISIPDSHPAHHIWHELRDRRAEFKIGPFSTKEATEMIGTLERAVTEKIESPLRRHLLEQSQGLPWLLKKFCVHIYRKLQDHVSQRELVGSQLDAKSLFLEDTQSLQADQLACLKYIALNSPADIVDVHEKYGSEIPDMLYSNRLVVRSGTRYIVYWDIFREFLITDKIPAIPVTYIPQSQVSTALTVLRFIRDEGPTNVEAIAAAFSYTIKTIWNITGDLSSFFLIERVQPDKLRIISDLQESNDMDIANHLANELSRHIIFMLFKSRVQLGQSLASSEMNLMFSDIYPSSNPDTIQVYTNRLLPWLEFSGLIEVDEFGSIVRPIVDGRGRGKGKVTKRRSSLNNGRAVFVCSASPRRVVDLAYQLTQEKELTRGEVEGSANRNAALDLSALGLATWSNTKLRPEGRLLEVYGGTEEEVWQKCYQIVRNLAMQSNFIKLLSQEITNADTVSDEDIYTSVTKALKRDWLPDSALRYVNAGRSWLRYFGYLNKLQGQASLFDNENLE